jgi:hypothetical protein
MTRCAESDAGMAGELNMCAVESLADLPGEDIKERVPDSVEVQAFLICDSVMRDAQSGKSIISGVFENVFAPSFPVEMAQLAAYFRVRILDRSIRHTVSLSRMSPSGLRENMPLVDLAVAPNGIAEGSINIMGFPFPSPGGYRIDLMIDGMVVAGFSLTAHAIAQATVSEDSNAKN